MKLFAVMADERDGGGFCCMAITPNLKHAWKLKRQIVSNHTLGINRLAKVIRPSNDLVQAFLDCGNKITDTH